MPEEHIIYAPANEGSEVEEFAIDPVQGRLQEIPFSRIFTIK